jgi:hypothetical protein
MVQFNDRNTGEQVELSANTPQLDAIHHEQILKQIAAQYRVASSLGKNAPATVLDQLDAARDAAFTSMKAHKEGNMISAHSNMRHAAALSAVAAEHMGIPTGLTPEVQKMMDLANKSADVNDEYMRQTNGNDYTVGRFN